MAQKTQNLENQRFCKVLILFKYCKSDRRRIRTFDRLLRRQVLYPAELCDHSSGWQDSNLRPPAPKAGAITGLRYTPKVLSISIHLSVVYAVLVTVLHPENKKAERQGLEPWRQLPVDRLAICSVTTPAPLLIFVV